MVPKKGKVAFIHPDLGIGGAERLILDMANALADEYEITFLTNHFDQSHAFDELKNDEYKIEVYGDWLPNSLFGKFRALCAYFRMVYLVTVYLFFYKNNNTFDLYIVDLIPIAVPFLRLFNLNVIYYCHHPDLLATSRKNVLKKLYRKPIDWLECKATKMSKVTLVNSEYTAEIFRKTFPEIQNNLQILYPTISQSVVELIENQDQVNINEILEEIPRDSHVFLSINRFHPAKNLEISIEAMNYLKKNFNSNIFSKFYLILAGGYDPNSYVNAEYFEFLQNLTKKYDLNKQIIFIKSPTDLRKVQLLLSCTCLIYTPVKEHFGIVPLEAMMAKKPVIAFNSGGPKETVQDGYNGYLCDPDRLNSLPEAMSKIITDNVDMGANGFQKLKQQFSNEIFEIELKKIVNSSIFTT